VVASPFLHAVYWRVPSGGGVGTMCALLFGDCEGAR